jgi:hypothetical protein
MQLHTSERFCLDDAGAGEYIDLILYMFRSIPPVLGWIRCSELGRAAGELTML